MTNPLEPFDDPTSFAEWCPKLLKATKEWDEDCETVYVSNFSMRHFHDKRWDVCLRTFQLLHNELTEKSITNYAIRVSFSPEEIRIEVGV